MTLPDWRRRPGTATGAMVLGVLSAVSLGPLGALIGFASQGLQDLAGAVGGYLAALAAVVVLVGVGLLRGARAWWPLVAGCAVLVAVVAAWVIHNVSEGDGGELLALFAVSPLGAAALGATPEVRVWVGQTRAAGPG